MGDTLSDLYREAGLESAAARASREGTPPPIYRRPEPNSAAARQYNETRRGPEVSARHRAQQAYAPPRNQVAELPQLLAETTGIPSLSRAFQGYTDGVSGTENDQASNEQAIWGGLGALGMLGALPASRGRPALPARQPFPDFGAPPSRPPLRGIDALDAGPAGGRTFDLAEFERRLTEWGDGQQAMEDLRALGPRIEEALRPPPVDAPPPRAPDTSVADAQRRLDDALARFDAANGAPRAAPDGGPPPAGTPPRRIHLTGREQELRDFLIQQRRPMTDQEIAAAWPPAEGSVNFARAIRTKLEIKGTLPELPDRSVQNLNTFDESEAARAFAERPAMDQVRSMARNIPRLAEDGRILTVEPGEIQGLIQEGMRVKQAGGDVDAFLRDLDERYYAGPDQAMSDVREEVMLWLENNGADPFFNSPEFRAAGEALRARADFLSDPRNVARERWNVENPLPERPNGNPSPPPQGGGTHFVQPDPPQGGFFTSGALRRH